MNVLLLFLLLSTIHVSVLGRDDFDHEHYMPDNLEDSILHDDMFVSDKEHIKEDFLDMFGFFFDISKEDVDKAYFTVHDYNNDSRLDGLELMKAIQHVHHDHGHKKEDKGGNVAIATGIKQEGTLEKQLEKVVVLVDNIMNKDDKNHDGFISFDEYVSGRQVKKHLMKS